MRKLYVGSWSARGLMALGVLGLGCGGDGGTERPSPGRDLGVVALAATGGAGTGSAGTGGGTAGSGGGTAGSGSGGTVTCDTRDAQGSPVLAACTLACRKRYVRWQLLATSYNIPYTWGNGEHTGYMLVESLYWVDDRWTSSAVFNDPEVDGSTFVPPGIMCGSPQQPKIKKVFNHGRTVHHSKSQRRVVATRQSPLSTRQDDTTSAAAQTWQANLSSMSDCAGMNNSATTTSETDGFCDSQCGNCSYVLPGSACGDGVLGTWNPPQTKVVESSKHYGPCNGNAYRAQSSCPVPEDGGLTFSQTCDSAIPNAYSCADSLYGSPGRYIYRYAAPSPFTSCGTWSNSDATNDVCLSSGLTGFPVYSGKWGHNSNTDGNALTAAFNTCSWGSQGWKSPTVRSQVCGLCGKNVFRDTVEGGIADPATLYQDPCVRDANGRGTNRAANQADDQSDGVGFDVNCNTFTTQGECGYEGPKSPVCKSSHPTLGGQPVNGM